MDVSGTGERSLLLESDPPQRVARIAFDEPPPSRLRFGSEDAFFKLGGQLLTLRFAETEESFSFDDS